MAWLSYLELRLFQLSLGMQTWGHPEQGVSLSNKTGTVVRTGHVKTMLGENKGRDRLLPSLRVPQVNSYPSKAWKRQSCGLQKEGDSASNSILDFKLLELWDNKVLWLLTSQIVVLYYSDCTEENIVRHNDLAILQRKNELQKAKLFFNVA